MNRILRRRMLHTLMTLLRVLFCLLFAATLRAGDEADSLRRKLEPLQSGTNPAVLDLAWPHLDSPDQAVREVARKAVQAQPFATWKDRALEEKSTWASLELLRALAESCPRNLAASLSPHLCEQITTLRFEHMDPPQWLASIHLTRLVFRVLGPLTEDERQQMLDLWTQLSPSPGAAPSKELGELLEFLRTARPRQL
jgi:hypothetical protein